MTNQRGRGTTRSPAAGVERWGAANMVVHHGALADQQISVDYYTSQPAPTQWIAVGLVSHAALGTRESQRLVVGNGRTEDAAVSALRSRVAQLHGTR